MKKTNEKRKKIKKHSTFNDSNSGLIGYFNRPRRRKRVSIKERAKDNDIVIDLENEDEKEDLCGNKNINKSEMYDNLRGIFGKDRKQKNFLYNDVNDNIHNIGAKELNSSNLQHLKNLNLEEATKTPFYTWNRDENALIAKETSNTNKN